MKISRQIKEIINMVLFVVVVAALVVAYVVYPLNRTKATMGRYDVDDYDEDSLRVNDPSLWIEAGLAADSFRVEADGLTTLACLYVEPDSTARDSSIGTVFLLHDDGADRDSILALAGAVVEAGYAVAAWDQRAAGRSTAKYHGDGQYEAADLEEVIRFLDLRQKIRPPLFVVGFGLGGEAALLTAFEDQRIDKVIAINPYLSTHRMLDMLKERNDSYWFPFYRTMMWWWYEIRSGYAAPYREIDDIKGVPCPTLVLMGADEAQDPEVGKLRELSDEALLRVEDVPLDPAGLTKRILFYLAE